MQPEHANTRNQQQQQQFQLQMQPQQGPQQLKTPEYLMQRLNDMKNKVQTLVGGNTVPAGQAASKFN